MRQSEVGGFVIQTTKPFWEERTIKHIIDANIERTYFVCMFVGIIMLLLGLVM